MMRNSRRTPVCNSFSFPFFRLKLSKKQILTFIVRNILVPGRLFFGSLCLAVSAFTSKGTGFTVALGLGDILAAILMGNTVGGFAGASK